MNKLPGEHGYEPSSEDYVKSYILFYGRRLGEDAFKKISEEGTDEISMTAKTHLVDDLYKNLDTLDNKAGALLTFCGVVLTSIAIMISINHNVKYVPVLYILFVAVAFSSVLALTVIDVHWSKAKEISQRSLEDACYSYYTTKLVRTRRYLWAWKIAVVSISVLGTYVFLDLLFSKLAIMVR